MKTPSTNLLTRKFYTVV